MPPILQIFRDPEAEGLPLPAYQTEGAAGFDLTAAIPAGDPLVIGPGKRALVPTGLRVAVPAGHELQIRPRSGLAVKNGLSVLNTPGTVDEDYRGPLGVVLINHDTEFSFTVNRGDRIAQAVIAPVTRAAIVEVASVGALGKTARGDGGFGSTGS